MTADAFAYCMGCGQPLAFFWDDDEADLVSECPSLCAWDDEVMDGVA